MTREAELERIKRLIADLEAAGVTLYKLALLCNVQYATLAHWKKTGRVSSYDAHQLEALHRIQFQPPLQLTPNFLKTSAPSTAS